MTIRLRQLAIVGIVVFLGVSLMATVRDPQRGEYIVRGVGTVSCGAWTASARSDRSTRAAYVSWVHGFLTGTAEAIAERVTLRSVDSDAIEAWVDQHCQQQPIESLHSAAEKLFVALKQPAPTTAP